MRVNMTKPNGKVVNVASVLVDCRVKQGWVLVAPATPDDSWTKTALKSYMNENGIEYNSGDTKADLLTKINTAESVEAEAIDTPQIIEESEGE